MIRSCTMALAAIMALSVSPLRAATTVAFVGGEATYQWQQSAAFKNAMAGGIGYGFPTQMQLVPAADCVEAGPALTVVKSLLAAGPNKPSIIHLMVGQYDSGIPLDSNPEWIAMGSFETCFAALVQTIQAAKEPLIIGLPPFSVYEDVRPYNQFMYAYALVHNIPVIDYYTMMAVESNPDIYPSSNVEPGPADPTGGPGFPTVTATGWSLMTTLANSAIAQAFGGVKLRSGYLNNAAIIPSIGDGDGPYPNVNTVPLYTKMQWQAEGQYSNGLTMEINNANFAGVFGTWTTSNPSVMTISPTGESFAIGAGTANIKFTTFAGVTISEWIMHVEPYIPGNPPYVQKPTTTSRPQTAAGTVK